ncbi:hypothetical protein QE152_g33555 [Popillia japonica]|uniref:Transposase n=1 Tax=Popillia japonica TaxID=7064 RepID=A0AAW1IWP6_POPJA
MSSIRPYNSMFGSNFVAFFGHKPIILQLPLFPENINFSTDWARANFLKCLKKVLHHLPEKPLQTASDIGLHMKAFYRWQSSFSTLITIMREIAATEHSLGTTAAVEQ